ncbi:hypothetical protein PCE1_001290 [Barthelona sp. PCE]
MRVLLLGGTGFIGHHAARCLCDEGYDVRVLHRRSSDLSVLDGLQLEKVVGDMFDPESLEDALSDVGVVLCCSGSSAWDVIGSNLVFRDLDMIFNLFEAVKAAGRPIRVITLSSVAAVSGTSRPVVCDERDYSDESIAPYVAFKLEFEAMCRKYVADGLDIVILCPAEVFGVEDYRKVTCGNVIDAISGSCCSIVPRGGITLCSVTGVARAMVSAIDKGVSGERYVLGGPRVTIREFYEACQGLSGHELPCIELPGFIISPICRFFSFFRFHIINPSVIPYIVRYC